MKKKIGFWTALALTIGNIIGVGIFTTTGYLAGKIQNPYFILLAWGVGAVYAYTGAKTYGILAGHMPYQGGDYAYFKEHYHPYFSYLFGWSAIFITYTGSIAALGIGSAHYLNDVFPNLGLNYSIFSIGISGDYFFSLDGFKIAGILSIIILTYLNYLGIQTGGRTQIVLTAAIVFLMITFIFIGLIDGATGFVNNPEAEVYPSWNSFSVGLVAVLFTYMGWTTVNYIANEVESPKKIIPKALITGIIVVVAVYLGINYVFLSVLSPAELSDKINSASLVAGKLWGPQATKAIAAMILIAILSSLNSTVLSGPRIYQAMSRDGYLWSGLVKEHKKYASPAAALWTQCVWSIVLMLSGTFNQLLTIVVAAILLFSIMSGTISFKIMLYSAKLKLGAVISVTIYLLLCALILFNILYSNFIESLIGLIILLVSYPFYKIQTVGRT
ncbi:MAG: APC family permease [Calditrichaceae bacterium]